MLQGYYPIFIQLYIHECMRARCLCACMCVLIRELKCMQVLKRVPGFKVFYRNTKSNCATFFFFWLFNTKQKVSFKEIESKVEDAQNIQSSYKSKYSVNLICKRKS